MNTNVRYVEYHSPQWTELKEEGWVTMTVHDLRDGTTLARMLWIGRPVQTDDPNFCRVCTPKGLGYCRCEVACNE